MDNSKSAMACESGGLDLFRVIIENLHIATLDLLENYRPYWPDAHAVYTVRDILHSAGSTWHYPTDGNVKATLNIYQFDVSILPMVSVRITKENGDIYVSGEYLGSIFKPNVISKVKEKIKAALEEHLPDELFEP